MKRKGSFFTMQALTSCISMTLVLVLLGAVVFFVMSARRLSDQVKENITLTLLLDDDASDLDIQNIQKDLQSKHYVKNITFISKEKALKEMTQEMGTDPSEFLGHNPFSASLEMGLRANYANKDSIQWIIKDLKATPHVVDMVHQQEWLDTINEMIEKISLVLLVLAGLLTFISFVLINNTLRLSVYSKRFLINTMKLVGASWSFIRRPFLWKSMSLGFIAGLAADCLLTAGLYFLLKLEPDLTNIITRESVILTGTSVIIFGLLITFLCAYVSVNRFLNMRTKDLYTA